jgi:hypothetical protein
MDVQKDLCWCARICINLQDHKTKEIYNPYKKDEKEGGKTIRGQKGGRG